MSPRSSSLTAPSPPGTPGGEGRGEGGQNPSRNLEIPAGSIPLTPNPSPREYRGRGERGRSLACPLSIVAMVAFFLCVTFTCHTPAISGEKKIGDLGPQLPRIVPKEPQDA